VRSKNGRKGGEQGFKLGLLRAKEGGRASVREERPSMAIVSRGLIEIMGRL
jgi:hypothetical protein